MGRKRSLVFGHGYNTLDSVPTSINGKHTFEHRTWCNMLKRCYGQTESCKNKTYWDKVVCDDWLDYKNFYEWITNVKYRQEGWQLDKDLLRKGNKVYGPEFCVFLPPALNAVILSCKASRGDLPVGVHFDKARGKFKATCCNEHGKQWQKRFNTSEEAFKAYKQEKERVISSLAEKYKETIDPRAYQALINYKIEITD